MFFQSRDSVLLKNQQGSRYRIIHPFQKQSLFFGLEDHCHGNAAAAEHVLLPFGDAFQVGGKPYIPAFKQRQQYFLDTGGNFGHICRGQAAQFPVLCQTDGWNVQLQFFFLFQKALQGETVRILKYMGIADPLSGRDLLP